MGKDTKIKIFLFVLFIALGIVVFAETRKIINNSVDRINFDKKMIDCTNIKFDVLDSTYVNRKLIIQLESSSASTSFANLIVSSDDGDERTLEISGNQTGIQTLMIENISISKKFDIFLEECNQSKKTKQI